MFCLGTKNERARSYYAFFYLLFCCFWDGSMELRLSLTAAYLVARACTLVSKDAQHGRNLL